MGQCKCRSSDQSKEPGWHHEQPSWQPQQQQARQLGVDWGHPFFPFSSSLFAKLTPASREPKLVGKVNLCSGCPRPWWGCRFAEVHPVHGLLEEQLRWESTDSHHLLKFIATVLQ